MASQDASKTTKQRDDTAALKPGSSEADAHKVGGEGDFGAPAGGERTAERDYVSRNTKMSDPGAAQPWDWENDGKRDHGAGARDNGPGSASGGDIDPDIVGVGTGGSGIATSGVIGRPPGPDDSDGSSDEFAAGGHAQGRNQSHAAGKIGGAKRVQGTTHSADRDASTSDGQGAAAVTNPIHEAGGDVRHSPREGASDAFAGEVSLGEAIGEDGPVSPSSDTDDQSTN